MHDWMRSPSRARVQAAALGAAELCSLAPTSHFGPPHAAARAGSRSVSSTNPEHKRGGLGCVCVEHKHCGVVWYKERPSCIWGVGQAHVRRQSRCTCCCWMLMYVYDAVACLRTMRTARRTGLGLGCYCCGCVRHRYAMTFRMGCSFWR